MEDCSLPVSSVYGILQARVLEWIAMLSSRGSSRLEDQNPVLTGAYFTVSTTWEAYSVPLKIALPLKMAHTHKSKSR